MANKDDYLTDYRCFFENFAQTVNPNDQLPVKLGSYKLVNVEVVGGIIDWTTQYLTQKKCPQSLLAPIIKIVIEETRKLCKKQPTVCGFNPSDNAYEPLKLMQAVMAKTNEICLRYLDNSKLCSLPTPGPPYNAISVWAVKNNRRRMEDRHVVIHDLNSLFIEQEASPSSYYAIFDGHAGHDAAAYSCAHLHQFLAESKDFVSNPERALRDAFLKTDALFLDKCKVENFSSGTTAVCALLRHKEKTLYIAWVGDSQALLASQGRLIQCVQPHKPCRQDEKDRIEKAGGAVTYWGTWRVNGHLAVSRAIGDFEYKPFVTAVPDVVEIPLTGAEDFLILACDGLWDFITEDDAARCVYNMISNNPDDIDSISQRLVQLAKQQGSCDNISVIVVFLRETSKVAAEAHWATRNGLIMDTLDNANTTTNPFANSNNPEILAQKEGFVLNLAEGFKQNGTEKSPTADFLGRPTNGKRSADEFDDDDDLGPETDVDAVDDILLSPTIAAAKSLAEGVVNNNPSNDLFDPFFDNKEEKAKFETDSELQKQQSSEFDPIKSPREETPTPPADSVHDTSGLVDNVAESGDDSEDEWNYFKGDTAQKENIALTQTDIEVCELTKSDLDSDTMSQLNPNAAEFVPVSPKRNTASPAYQALIDDSVIAQSPRRVTSNDIDINVPNPQDFESEIKSRPSDVQECANGNEDNDEKLTSQEIMENLLNGKSIDEIEFQPNSTPMKINNKADEFHFGPNATPFTTPIKPLDQSEALSTKAVFGDESTASYLEEKGLDSSFVSGSDVCESQTCAKEQDPMSMSFYQDKDDDTNPFDLNKVQVLPENLDDFLEKPCDNNSFNETISDLPEHNPTEPTTLSTDVNNRSNKPTALELELNAELTFNTNDKSPAIEEQHPFIQSKSPLLQSPLPQAESPILQSQFPLPQTESPILQSQSPLPQSPSPLLQSPSPLLQSPSPLPQSPSPLPQSPSPLPQSQSPLSHSQSPIPQSQSPFPQSQSPLLQSQSPLPMAQPPVIEDHLNIKAASPIPQAQSPLFQSESPFLQTHSPGLQSPVSGGHSPFPLHPSQSPISSQPPLTPDSPLPHLESPAPTSQSPAPLSPVMQLHSPILSQSPLPGVESPLEDVTSSVKDSPILAASPLEAKDEEFKITASNVIQQSTEMFTQEISNVVQESLASNIEKVEDAILDACPISTPKSNASEPVDTESVVTADVNSFLERSLLPDVESPLSPTSTHSLQTKLETADDITKTNLLNDLYKGADTRVYEYSENIAVDIKSEIIAPEYPVEAIATPSEESKTEDLTQTLPQEITEKVAVVAGVTAAAGVAVVAATTITSTQKKTPIAAKSKTSTAAKKLAPKPATSPTKPPTPKSAPKAPTPRATGTSTTTKVGQVKTLTVTSSPKVAATSKPLAKPRTPTATKSPDKKPMTNGDIKPLSASTLTTKRTVSSATTAKPPATRLAPTKPSPTKLTVDSKLATARPATAPPKTTTVKQTTTRPTTLATRSTASSAAKNTTLSTVTATKSTVKTTSVTSPKTTTNLLSRPKPTTTTAMRSKPLASKPLPKAPDTEKQMKETTNKQITASRTLTATKTVGKATGTTLTVRKTETKSPGTRTTVTKTTTTTVKTISDPKKPPELVRHPANKAKTTAIKKIAKPQQNGIVTEVNTITVATSNIDPQLMKDVSPVIENLVLDNSQLLENNVAD